MTDAERASPQVRSGQTATKEASRMSSAKLSPDTIVLVHGFWMTPRSWEHWIARRHQKRLITITRDKALSHHQMVLNPPDSTPDLRDSLASLR
jgi:hypothetical protein